MVFLCKSSFLCVKIKKLNLECIFLIWVEENKSTEISQTMKNKNSSLYCRGGPVLESYCHAIFSCILFPTHLHQMNGSLPDLCRDEYHADEEITPFDSGVLKQG
ncbi:hypothetical protein GOODEAATRI_033937 [Goodea atripinnis]|uniref:Uncharacterized protein n=1 Tax=Goodea atripinnis TaxID=208336 RepID=A0ABV0PUA2_9TELE